MLEALSIYMEKEKPKRTLIVWLSDLFGVTDKVNPYLGIGIKLIPYIGALIAVYGLFEDKITDFDLLDDRSIYIAILVSNMLLVTGFFFLLPEFKEKRYSLVKEYFTSRGFAFRPISDDDVDRAHVCVEYFIKIWFYFLLATWGFYYFLETVNYFCKEKLLSPGIFGNSENEFFFFNLLNSIETVCYLGMVFILSCPTYNENKRKVQHPKEFIFSWFVFGVIIIYDLISKTSDSLPTFIGVGFVNNVGGIVTCISLAILVGKMGGFPFIYRIRYMAIIYGYAGIQALYPFYKNSLIESSSGWGESGLVFIYLYALIGKAVLLNMLLTNIKSFRLHTFLIFTKLTYKTTYAKE